MGFSWESFYAGDDWDRGAYIGGDDMSDHLDAFIEFAGDVDSVLSVGCGPATAEFDVAARRPDVDVHCVDVADPVVDANREKATDAGVENISFGVAGLPELDVDGEHHTRTGDSGGTEATAPAGQFDVVYCMAVLYFVADAERALEVLWRHVTLGGYLVCTYANRRMQPQVRAIDDPDRRDAFSLVAAGENLLSYDRIHDLLGTSPRNYWRAVDADPDAEYVTRPGAPAVYVRKSP